MTSLSNNYIKPVSFTIITLLISVYIFSVVPSVYESFRKRKRDMSIDIELEKYNSQLRTVLHELDYTDQMLFENNKYIYEIYKKNNNFEVCDKKGSTTKNTSYTKGPYFNMTKIYDALDKNS